MGEPTSPRTTAPYRLIPRKGRRLTPTPPHLGFQGGDPLPHLLPLRPEPLPFGPEPLAIRTGGLSRPSLLRITYPEALNKYRQSRGLSSG
jgi:hypothetical protein